MSGRREGRHQQGHDGEGQGCVPFPREREPNNQWKGEVGQRDEAGVGRSWQSEANDDDQVEAERPEHIAPPEVQKIPPTETIGDAQCQWGEDQDAENIAGPEEEGREGDGRGLDDAYLHQPEGADHGTQKGSDGCSRQDEYQDITDSGHSGGEVENPGHQVPSCE